MLKARKLTDEGRLTKVAWPSLYSLTQVFFFHSVHQHVRFIRGQLLLVRVHAKLL